SVDAGQKQKAGSTDLGGANFFIVGDVYLENCVSENAKYGYYLRSADTSAGGPVLINCQDTGSDYGIYFIKVDRDQGAYVESATLRNAKITPIVFTSAIRNVNLEKSTILWDQGAQNPGPAILYEASVPDPAEISLKDNRIVNYTREVEIQPHI
ncbi:MAG TPA: hypothetical protein VE134_05775, partial [Methanomicrobiales archaeon]|nr:hypothetical protein [Methanomicrobiales archaeon]